MRDKDNLLSLVTQLASYLTRHAPITTKVIIIYMLVLLVDINPTKYPIATISTPKATEFLAPNHLPLIQPPTTDDKYANAIKDASGTKIPYALAF